jgi:hypothetical protein
MSAALGLAAVAQAPAGASAGGAVFITQPYTPPDFPMARSFEFIT